MKSVLISIKPKWCELIENGEKTVEVRKSRPKIETPFKCYIYCTKSMKHLLVADGYLNGKVIGEFTCDRIEDWQDDAPPPVPLKDCCLTYSEVRRYGGTTETLYLWHISDLVIYDEPKELSEFKGRKLAWRGYNHIHEYEKLTRPPQSWQYVEVK